MLFISGVPQYILGNGNYLQAKDATNAARSIIGYAAGGNNLRILSSQGILELQPDIAQDIYLWGGTATTGTGRILWFFATASSAGATTKSSPTIRQRAFHWNGSNQSRDFEIIHSMVTAGAAPKSRAIFKMGAGDGAVAHLTLEDNNGTKGMGFFGSDPVVKQVATTAPLTTLTYTAPGTPDYALQDVTNVAPYGFVDAEELRTFISVVKNLQDVVTELRNGLGDTAGLSLFDLVA